MVDIACRFERLAKWYTGIETLTEPSVVGDIGDLYLRGAQIRELIDELLSVPLEESNRDLIKNKLIIILVRVEDFREIVRDLHDPLERLAMGSPSIESAAGEKKLGRSERRSRGTKND